MPVSCDHLDRFVRAVHRRWVIVRAAEMVGLAVLGGCGLAMLLLPILLWRGEPALPIVLTTTAIAAAGGLLAGIIRRPALRSAAAEADRQLDLADLLSTALLKRESSTHDDWAATVVAIADARCRTLAPNGVVLNRLGGRAWGGIGLAASFVLTLGLMSANPRSTEALAAAAVNPATDLNALASPPSSPSNPVASARGPRANPNAGIPMDREEAQPGGNDLPDKTASAAPADATEDAAGSDGSGAGWATSPQESRAASPSPVRLNDASPTDPDGMRTGGGGALSPPSDAHDAERNSSTIAAPSRDAASVPAWQSTSWPAARDQAISAVRDGRISEPYRDLIRDYFDGPRP